MVNVVTQRSGQCWLLEPEPDSVEAFHAALLGCVYQEGASQGQWKYREYIPSSPDIVISNSGSSMDGGDEGWLRERFSSRYRIRPATLLPGQYHPRIWRNGWSHTSDCRGFDAEYPRGLAAARRSAAASVHQLLVQLAGVFDVVEPSDTNRTAHGPEMRRVLLLACMEVEAAARGILTVNRYPDTNRLNTSDYVELLEPMRLNEYALRLTLYRDEWQYPVTPFLSWNSSHPTRSLSWYDAYNAAKHDRESNRHRADLQSVVDAVGAACILLVAQSGDRAAEVRAVLEHIAGFVFESQPEWRPEQLYFPADECGFEAVPLW